MASNTSPVARRDAAGLFEALTGLFGPRSDAAAASVRAPSAAELEIEKRRYAAQCMLLGLQACRRHEARRAFDNFHEAFVAFQQAGDRRSASLMKKAIGLVAQKIETPAKVRAAFAQARAMLQQAGLRDEEARALFLHADFEARQAAWNEAYALYEDSLQISRSIDYVVGEVECLCRYGWTLKAHGRVDDAKRRILEARKAAQERGDERLIASVTSWMQKFGPDEAPRPQTAKGAKAAVFAPAAGGAQRPWQPIDGANRDLQTPPLPPKGSIAALQQARAAAAGTPTAAMRQPPGALKKRVTKAARR